MERKMMFLLAGIATIIVTAVAASRRAVREIE